MTDLPSRDIISEALELAHISDSDGDKLMTIARAYALGRLVDREAINYEAAEVMLRDCPTYQPGQNASAWSRRIVVAALGGTDD